MRNVVASLLAVAGALVAILGSCDSLAAGGKPGDTATATPTLIVVFDPRQNVPTVESVLHTVNSHQGQQDNPALFGLLGQPVLAQRLLLRPPTSLEQRAAHDKPLSPDALGPQYLVLTYVDNTDLDALQDRLRHNPLILAVSKSLYFKFSSTPGLDPYLAPETPSSPTSQFQWGMGSRTVAQGALNFPDAWKNVTGHAYVAVIDMGIQAGTPANPTNVHPDLVQNFKRQFANNVPHPLWGREVDERIAGPTDVAGHGTHVAGIIAATTNNGMGVAGGCLNCSLMIERAALGANQGPDSVSIARAIDHAVQSGAQVLNISFGADVFDCSTGPNWYMAECTAIARALQREVTVVAASGNAGRREVPHSINFPANYPGVIAVGGSEPDGNPWYSGYSCGTECGTNSGPEQAVIAPAKDVLSTTYKGLDYNVQVRCGDLIDSLVVPAPGRLPTRFESGYGDCNGTSMAAPHITALAGLVRSANPLLDNTNTRSVITTTGSMANAPNPVSGYGVPDAGRAMPKALSTDGAVNRLTPLFGLYSNEGQNHFYTMVPQMAVAAILGTLQPAPRYFVYSEKGNPQSVECNDNPAISVNPCWNSGLSGGELVKTSPVWVCRPGGSCGGVGSLVAGVEVVFAEDPSADPNAPYIHMNSPAAGYPWGPGYISQSTDSGPVTNSFVRWNGPVSPSTGFTTAVRASALSTYNLQYGNVVGDPVTDYASFPTGGILGFPTPRAIAFVFSSNTNPRYAPELLPLYRMSYRCGDQPSPAEQASACAVNPYHVTHVYATSANDVEQFTGCTTSGLIPGTPDPCINRRGKGYALDGIEGYVFSRDQVVLPTWNAAKLCRKFDASRGDWALFLGSGTTGGDCSATNDGYIPGNYNAPPDGLDDWIGYAFRVIDGITPRPICANMLECEQVATMLRILSGAMTPPVALGDD